MTDVYACFYGIPSPDYRPISSQQINFRCGRIKSHATLLVRRESARRRLEPCASTLRRHIRKLEPCALALQQQSRPETCTPRRCQVHCVSCERVLIRLETALSRPEAITMTLDGALLWLAHAPRSIGRATGIEVTSLNIATSGLEEMVRRAILIPVSEGPSAPPISRSLSVCRSVVAYINLCL